MTTFLEMLGGKLAERWVTLVMLPGLLLMATAGVAGTLRHSGWQDLGLLITTLNRISTESALRTPGTLILVLAGALAASAGIGLAVAALGAGLERLWLGDRPRRLAARRAGRWKSAQAAFQAALSEVARAERAHAVDTPALAAESRRLNAARNRIAIDPPTHPFWLGDRIAAVEARVWRVYRLDLNSAWPRIWLTLPEDVRVELGAARTRLSSATRLLAWAAGYLTVGVVWWPAAVAGTITAATAWWRARYAGTAFAELIESTVDIYGRRLADTLGIPCDGRLTTDTGAEITSLLRKQT